MLGAKHRLGRSDALKQVIRRGRMTRTKGFSLRIVRTRFPVSRFAISISNKAHKHATARNRVRRQLVAILMSHMQDITPGYDCSIAAYKEAFEMTHKERAEHFMSLLLKSRLLPTQ